MAEPYRGFGSFVLFKEVLADELGHVYRAAECERSGIRRHVWLRLFDAPEIPMAEVGAQADTVNRIGEILQSAKATADDQRVLRQPRVRGADRQCRGDRSEDRQICGHARPPPPTRANSHQNLTASQP